MRSFTPFILLAVAIVAAIFVGKPLYDDVQTVRADNSQYEKAIQKGKEFENQIGVLTEKRNQFAPEDLARLQKMIPDNIDNVRLIIEINEIAKKYSSGIQNIQVAESNVPNAEKARQASRPFGSISMGFSITTTYDRFTQFLKALETNLRVADVTSLSFTPTDTGMYIFNLTVKTHWLKNTTN